MNNINLVPKIRRIQRLFIPLIIFILFLLIVMAGGLMFYRSYLQSGLTEKTNAELHSSASVQALMQQRTMDSQTAAYLRLSQDISQLMEKHTQWKPMMELVTSQLPEVSRLTAIETQARQSVTVPVPSTATTEGAVKSLHYMKLTAEFGELTSLAEYIARLQRSAMVESVTVQSVQRVEQETLREIESNGEELLNRLRLMMIQQSVVQQQPDSGVQENQDANPSHNPPGGDASEDSIQRQEELSPLPVQPVQQQQPILPKISKYTVSIELYLKP